MQIKVDANAATDLQADIKVFGVFQTVEKKGKVTERYYDESSIKDSYVRKELKNIALASTFDASLGSLFSFNCSQGGTYLLMGLGEKKNLTREQLRRNIAKLLSYKNKVTSLAVDASSFFLGNTEDSIVAMYEGLMLANYDFQKYKSNPKTPKLKTITLSVPKKNHALFAQIQKKTTILAQSVNFSRDLVNEVPNVLHSEKYAQIIAEDARKNLKGVKVKILNKAQVKAEKMNLFLSVNAGSAYEPRFVHLSYTPSKAAKKAKHIALVGKGITFDTGGYSLKPAANMTSMKYDMAGSATVYAAFRTAVLNKCPHKLTCLMAITDNAVNENATVPDAVVTSRRGKTVEILNTDAEGRLILADALDYACDLKPDVILDAATLTGAVLVALGDEVCGIMSNNDKLVKDLLTSAKESDEYLWQLPLIDEYRDAIKSKVADLKNIGKPMKAGTAIGGVFLEEFIKDGIAWAHFDIAGVAHDQAHLPYCPSQGASGLMVRTMVNYIFNE
ncbi:MAG: leucyl aminopeptidase [Bacteriovoracaceae bacterium]|nr:leucyl aminopeptidase [Bacteriovoracaceae bacterium]